MPGSPATSSQRKGGKKIYKLNVQKLEGRERSLAFHLVGSVPVRSVTAASAG